MKCTFCSLFASAGGSDDSVDRYVDFIVREIGGLSALTDLRKLALRNIYFGGGTPSTLKERNVNRIFEKIGDSFVIDKETVISAEFSPDSVFQSTAKLWRTMGTTRASVGVQSFDDNLLKSMHRKHDGRDALQAIETLRNADFSYVNIDLIYGNYNQDEGQWNEDVRISIRSQATRVSLYPLATKGKPALRAELKRGRFVPLSNANYRKLHFAALNEFRNAGWWMPSALSFSIDNRGNALEEAESDGIPTIGIGVGSRTYMHNIHSSSTRSNGQTVFGQEMSAYYDAVAQHRLPSAAIVEVDNEENVRRGLVLGVVGRGLKSGRVEEIHDGNLKDTIITELTKLQEDELIQMSDNEIVLTDNGILYAAEVGFRLASRSVQHLIG